MIRLPSDLQIISGLPLILWATLPIFSLAIPFEYPSPDSAASQINLDLIRRQNGNPNAAGDLYGVGLRVGAYLQIFGMLLSCLRTESRSRSGILLLSSSVCLSLFLALTILVAQYAISPSEAWLVLSLTAAYGTPRFCAANEEDKPKGGIAKACCLLSLLWQQVFYFWFWTTLYRQLPLLGTDNVVWFFVPVALGGWFRIFMLVTTCLDSLSTAASIGPYLSLILLRFVFWTGAPPSTNGDKKSSKARGTPQGASQDESSKATFWDFWDNTLRNAGTVASSVLSNKYFDKFVAFSGKFERAIARTLRYLVGDRPKTDAAKALAEFGSVKYDNLKDNASKRKYVTAARDAARERKEEYGRDLRAARIMMAIKGFVILVLTIAGIEKIIEYNSLSPTSDLSEPGQVIPFILGIITVIVGASHAIQPRESPKSPAKTPSTQTQKLIALAPQVGIPNDDSNTDWTHLHN